MTAVFSIFVAISFLTFASQPRAQEEQEAQAFDNAVTIDGSGLNIPQTYSIVNDEGAREELDLQSLAESYKNKADELGVSLGEESLEDTTRIEEALAAEDETFSTLINLKNESAGLEDIYLDELFAFINAGALCYMNGGIPLSKLFLIVSEMDLHYNLDTKGAQIDIDSRKGMICFSLDQLDFELVQLRRRWVVNVANEALVHKVNKLAPNGNTYAFYLGAKGTAISLVSYYVDGVLQPSSDWNYGQSPDSCIDIFFTFVPPTDGPIIISDPIMSLFCAGGACKQTPPGLDATH
jgi:hypothetical protein